MNRICFVFTFLLWLSSMHSYAAKVDTLEISSQAMQKMIKAAVVLPASSTSGVLTCVTRRAMALTAPFWCSPVALTKAKPQQGQWGRPLRQNRAAR